MSLTIANKNEEKAPQREWKKNSNNNDHLRHTLQPPSLTFPSLGLKWIPPNLFRTSIETNRRTTHNFDRIYY